MLRYTAMFVAGLAIVGQSIASQLPINNEFTVQLVNGETGKPVRWRGSPSIRLSSGRTINKHTNLSGREEVQFSIPNDRDVQVSVDFIDKDCRTKNYSTIAETYSIESILHEGLVSQNFCGAHHQQAHPGVLVIYVIPATFKELWYE